jgi:hypothetical protein
VWLGFVHWVQGVTCTVQSRLEGSSGVGTATGLSVEGDNGSGELVVLALLGAIVGTLSDGPCGWWGGGFFGGPSVFLTGAEVFPPVYW